MVLTLLSRSPLRLATLAAFLAVGACADAATGPLAPAVPSAPSDAKVRDPGGTAASVSVTPGEVVFFAVGDSLQLAAQSRDRRGTVLTGRTYVWTSSSPESITVSASGMARAVGPGTAMIRATDGAAYGQAFVQVAELAGPIEEPAVP